MLLGLGLTILANTRPFEGFVFSLPIVAALFMWAAKQVRIRRSDVLLRVALPLAVILAATGLAMGYYFWRVTGNAFVMPYQVNRQTYSVAPYFVWQKERPEPVYHHTEMRDFYVNWELPTFERGKTFGGFLVRAWHKFAASWLAYVGPVFSLALFSFPFLFRDRRMRLPLVIAASVCVGCLIETWTLAQYLAPAVGLFYLLLVQCLRHLRLWRWRDRPVGRGLARAIPVICIAMVVLRVTAVAAGVSIEPLPSAESERNAIEHKLEKMPGEQLVIVRYGPQHNVHDEWVYNRADIDAAKIVWARDMGASQNQELLRYFAGRHAWLVNADDPLPKLEDYSSAVAAP
jgi:hypothetical protein